MGINTLRCSLCGFHVAGTKTLRTLGPGTNTVGVGIYDDPDSQVCVVPAKENGRWDDPGYESAPKMEFDAFNLCYGMRWQGFIFHEACWSLLQQVYRDKQTPIARILEVLESLPIPLTDCAPNWDHNYGGLKPLTKKDTFLGAVNGRKIISAAIEEQRLYPAFNPYKTWSGWTNALSQPRSEPLAQTDLKWKKLAGKFPIMRSREVKLTPMLTEPTFEDGCRELRKENTPISHDLARIAIYLVIDRDRYYISRFQFIAASGKKISLGSCTDELVLVNNLDMPVLRGIILPAGTKGIHRLRIATASRSLTPWIGYHDECPKSRRHVTDGPLTALEAGFDAFKLVSLAVGEESTPCSSSDGNQDSALRNQALWFPYTPSPDLCVGELAGRNPIKTDYQPFCWVCFGGPGGDHLQSLKQITTPGGGAGWLRFHYASDIDTVTLGRGHSDPEDIFRFTIDGKGGELIENVKVELDKNGVLESSKISTNRGRKFHPRLRKPQVELPMVKLGYPAGTTITGSYGHVGTK
ncbi:hypothetical protein AJ79_02189 [Helicocarpus griseus UAMH5409]|uniref:DUF7600 domain-containing protein n=1 Tax=Helicocarpus griseus UAMH5409 TaxID=1447875 RepID=A0A2B7Y4N6_9EURO|nr:hypothetical protein AJ79_02189 [Helicocarpus griseus UAMH5409]